MRLLPALEKMVVIRLSAQSLHLVAVVAVTRQRCLVVLVVEVAARILAPVLPVKVLMAELDLEAQGTRPAEAAVVVARLVGTLTTHRAVLVKAETEYHQIF